MVFIIIIIIITGSDKHGFSSSTDVRTIHKKQKSFLFLSAKEFPDLEKRFSSRVSQVTEGGSGKPAYRSG